MPDELTSWKEIAAFLGVSVKTAQVWERDRALPIHRLPGQRSFVRARPEELIAWRERSLPAQSLPAQSPPRPAFTQPFRRHWSFVVIAITVAIAIAALFAFRHRARNPATLQVQGNSIVVFDASGQEIWRKRYPSLEARSSSPLLSGRYYQLVDLENDGSVEVLFSHLPIEHMNLDRGLWCYNADGSVRWKFQPGRTVRTSTQAFPPPFRPLNISVGALVPGGPKKIVVSSIQVPWWANQIAILDASGKLEREYWHSGAIFSLELGDANSDGYAEIYAGGINNARRQATLLVLDPRTMNGASREPDPAFQLLDFPPPVEQTRVFFPRSCTAAGHPYNALRQIVIAPNSVIAETWEHPYGPNAPTIFYYFDQSIKPLRSAVSDRFRAAHEELHAAGTLNHPLTDKEIASLQPLFEDNHSN